MDVRNKHCGPEQPLSPAERLVEHHADQKGGFYGEVRVTCLTTRDGPRSRPPAGKRGLIDPEGQAAAPAQPRFIRGPIRHPERHLGDAVAMGTIVLEGHGGRGGQNEKAALLHGAFDPANRSGSPPCTNTPSHQM